ncbi:hypothetical protein BGX26_011429 [Mortierella sp. AD094]|nr:hypothetical protein BGX26_011429 [Mortierella sp. AD094]
MVNAFLDSLGLGVLDNHWKTLLGSAVACNFIVQLSQLICPALFPATYPKLQGAKKLNWDVHVVSTVHAITIVFLAAPLLWNETLMKNKIFGYDYYAGQVYSVACGYFLWDTLHSIRHMKEFGIGFVFHGLCSFSVFMLGFRPFLQYYGSVFLMFELSTPFLNIHWFMDKLGMTGSIYQLVNGVILLSLFLSVRIMFGIYMSYQTYQTAILVIDQIPLHLIIVYSLANVILNSLNIYWFYKMIESLMKRFRPSKKGGKDKGNGSVNAKRD